ncbi:metal ABC transporter permease [Ammoniphilus sp. CFH 90114]|uniref:metal ABC transporter permease n=1 Tax=Ammoniphilus sp. CFH 90114 TaxID=2493665 RepID=UPI0013E956CF|nr:metal ABC transporter permease [Ammoniphilus sp. CFH 90114]
MEFVVHLFDNPNASWVITGCLLLGLSSGVLGCFALFKKYSLMGDAVAHAALPGICLAYMLYGTKSIGLFMIGASLAGLLGALCIGQISAHTKIKPDTAMAVILTGFFGIGIVLLTKISQSGNASQSGLDAFLFGKAASLVGIDVQVISVVAFILLAVTFFLFKELKLLCFDPQFGKGIGLPMGALNTLLMLMIVLAVVIGLQAVGVVLMAAMLIIPSVAARYWTEKLNYMVILSGTFGALSGILGTILSALTPNLPTGPVIVLAATFMFFLSLLFAPERGLLAKLLRHLKLRKKIVLENILQSLYDLSEKDYVKGKSPHTGYTIAQMKHLRPHHQTDIEKGLHDLRKQGLVVNTTESSKNNWSLSERGLQVAYSITLNDRLYEMLLMNQAQYGSIQVDQEKGRIQDQVSEQTLHELQGLLSDYNRKPQLIPQLAYKFDKKFRDYYEGAPSKGGDV